MQNIYIFGRELFWQAPDKLVEIDGKKCVQHLNCVPGTLQVPLSTVFLKFELFFYDFP